jgi:type IV pilus assembly protein PilQ
MDFENADLRDVIKVVAYASGLNMVIGKDVDAKVTISLKDVPWDKALDIVLKTYNFTYKREGNLIRVMTFDSLKREERDIPLETKIIYLNFLGVNDCKDALSKTLSERGSLVTDPRTNALIVTDTPSRISDIERVAKELDTRTPQVLIETMLVDITLSEQDDLGINWRIYNTEGSRLGGEPGRAADAPGVPLTPGSGGGKRNYVQQGTVLGNIGNSAWNIRFGKVILGSLDIDGLVSFWVENRRAKVLANPKVVTLDNQEANIQIVTEIPYQEQSQSSGQSSPATSTAFKQVGTTLVVKPHITKDGYISMNLKPEQNTDTGTVGYNNIPIIATRKAETNVLVKDGETIVIGGLRRVDDTITYDKMPILGDMPLIGSLFRRKVSRKTETELLMFVTPRVITHMALTMEEREKYKSLDNAKVVPPWIMRERQRWDVQRIKQDNERIKKEKLQDAELHSKVEVNVQPIEEITPAVQEPVLQETAPPTAPIAVETLPEEAPAVSAPVPKKEQNNKDNGYVYTW